MKKVLVSLLTVAMASTMVFAFTGCGKSESSSSAASESSQAEQSSDESSEDSSAAEDSATEASVVGTWTLTGITDAEGNQQTLEEYAAANGVDSQGLQATYTFEEGDKVTADIGGVGAEGTYTFDGSTVTTTFNGTDAQLSYDAENSTLSAQDENTGITSTFAMNAAE